MIRLRQIVIVFLLLAIVTGAAADQAAPKAKPKRTNRAKSPALAQIDSNPSLPNVLLIGDSISIGYTLPVRAALVGEANVHRPAANCGPTTRGLEAIDNWLGDTKWDVIHFNWGLHDLKYMGSDGKNLADPNDPKSHQQVPPDQYQANLQKLVARLKKTGATLIWCSTTPVPDGSAGRVAGHAEKYNAIAAKVMKSHDVTTDDLFSFAKPRLKDIQRPANVHFTPDGSAQLAEQVAASIRAALKKSQ